MRVSDKTLEIACRIPSDGTPTENTIHDLSLDLRDARAELAAIKRTREQEQDYANVCYRNQQLEAALNGIHIVAVNDKSGCPRCAEIVERCHALETNGKSCSDARPQGQEGTVERTHPKATVQVGTDSVSVADKQPTATRFDWGDDPENILCVICGKGQGQHYQSAEGILYCEVPSQAKTKGDV